MRIPHDAADRPMRFTGVAALAVASFALFVAGCGGSGRPRTVAVKGTVVYKGQPLTEGKVIFAPVDAQKGRPAEGRIGSDGSFALSTFAPGDGIIPGEYIVMIDPTPPPDESGDKKTASASTLKFPKKYLKRDSSGLKQSITDKVTDLKLDLKD